MNVLKSGAMHVLTYTPVWAIALALVVMASHITGRTHVMVNGLPYDAVIYNHTELSVAGVGSIYPRLGDGKLMTRHGIWGARGRLPLIWTVPSTPAEVAVYHQIF